MAAWLIHCMFIAPVLSSQYLARYSRRHCSWLYKWVALSNHTTKLGHTSELLNQYLKCVLTYMYTPLHHTPPIYLHVYPPPSYHPLDLPPTDTPSCSVTATPLTSPEFQCTVQCNSLVTSVTFSSSNNDLSIADCISGQTLSDEQTLSDGRGTCLHCAVYTQQVL